MQVFEVRAEEMTVDNLAAGWRVAGIALHPHLDVAYMARYSSPDRRRRNLVVVDLASKVATRWPDHQHGVPPTTSRDEEFGATGVAVHPSGRTLSVASYPTSQWSFPGWKDAPGGFTAEAVDSMMSMKLTTYDLDDDGIPVADSATSLNISTNPTEAHNALLFHPLGRYLYVGGNGLAWLQVDTGGHPLGVAQHTRTGFYCAGLAMSPDRRFLYASMSDGIAQFPLRATHRLLARTLPVGAVVTTTDPVMWSLPDEVGPATDRPVLVTAEHVYSGSPPKDTPGFGRFGQSHGIYRGTTESTRSSAPSQLYRADRPIGGWTTSPTGTSVGSVLIGSGDRGTFGSNQWAQNQRDRITVVIPSYVTDELDGNEVLVRCDVLTVQDGADLRSGPPLVSKGFDRTVLQLAVAPSGSDPAEVRAVVLTEPLPSPPSRRGEIAVRVFVLAAETDGNQLPAVDLMVGPDGSGAFIAGNVTVPVAAVPVFAVDSPAGGYASLNLTSYLGSRLDGFVHEDEYRGLYLVARTLRGYDRAIWTVAVQFVADGQASTPRVTTVAGSDVAMLVATIGHPAWQNLGVPLSSCNPSRTAQEDIARLRALAENVVGTDPVPTRAHIRTSPSIMRSPTPVADGLVSSDVPLIGQAMFEDLISLTRTLGHDSLIIPGIDSWHQLDAAWMDVVASSMPGRETYINTMAGYFVGGEWTVSNIPRVVENALGSSPGTRLGSTVPRLEFCGEDDYRLVYRPNGWSLEFATIDPDPAFQRFVRTTAPDIIPADLGQASWNDISFQWPMVEDSQREVSHRRLVYWSSRFVRHQAALAMAEHGRAIRAAAGDGMAERALWGGLTNSSVGAEPADWVNGVATQPLDLLPDLYLGASMRACNPLAYLGREWLLMQPYIVDQLRCAAMDIDISPQASGGQSAGIDGDHLAFGAYLDEKTLGVYAGDGPALSMTLLGRGSRYIPSYMFGPTWMFHDGWAGGGFDEAAMRDAVAINRLVSGADAALGIGSPTRSRIAMLTVDISGLWDQEVRRAGRRTIVDENRAIYWALRLEGHQVDFVTDEDVARGVLASRDYAILYITSPCLSKAAQACVRSFVNIGGSLVLGLEAASSDEANDMSVNLGDLTGSTRCSPAQVGPFALHLAEGMLDPTLPPSGKFDHGLVVGPVGPLIPTATGVTTVARFASPDGSDGGAAITMHTPTATSGRVWAYGFFGGLEHEHSMTTYDGAVPCYYPDLYDDAIREFVNMPVATAGLRPEWIGPLGVECFTVRSHSAVAVTVVNWTDDRPQQIDLTVYLADWPHAVKLASGRRLKTRPGGPTGSTVCTFELNDAEVIMASRIGPIIRQPPHLPA